MAVWCALLIFAATPALAASGSSTPVTQRNSCAADTGTSPFDEFGELRCTHGADFAQERVEAIIAGVGVIALAGAAFVYRRRRHKSSAPREDTALRST